MARPGALQLALDFAAMPVLANIVRGQPLPEDVLDVIKIAAGCPETSARAERMTGQSAEAIRQAAMLYLQSVLFAAGTDHYRVLGVRPTASHTEIREHMRWLMKWLHPDRQHSNWEAAFAARVLVAWQALKSPDRRARYDQDHPQHVRAPLRRRPQALRIPWISGPSPDRPDRFGLPRRVRAKIRGVFPVLYRVLREFEIYLKRRKADLPIRKPAKSRGESEVADLRRLLRERSKNSRPRMSGPEV